MRKARSLDTLFHPSFFLFREPMSLDHYLRYERLEKMVPARKEALQAAKADLEAKESICIRLRRELYEEVKKSEAEAAELRRKYGMFVQVRSDPVDPKKLKKVQEAEKAYEEAKLTMEGARRDLDCVQIRMAEALHHGVAAMWAEEEEDEEDSEMEWLQMGRRLLMREVDQASERKRVHVIHQDWFERLEDLHPPAEPVSRKKRIRTIKKEIKELNEQLEELEGIE